MLCKDKRQNQGTILRAKLRLCAKIHRLWKKWRETTRCSWFSDQCYLCRCSFPLCSSLDLHLLSFVSSFIKLLCCFTITNLHLTLNMNYNVTKGRLTDDMWYFNTAWSCDKDNLIYFVLEYSLYLSLFHCLCDIYDLTCTSIFIINFVTIKVYAGIK